MQTLSNLTAILVLAALAEALVEYLVSPIIKRGEGPLPDADQLHAGLDWRDLALRYTAAGVGVVLCVLYGADLLALFGLVPPWPWAGWIITGLLIGRGSNFVHDFAARWLEQG